MFDRAILHLDLDAFFVSVECLRNSALKGKPVIIGGSSGRGVVASCSYEARRFGVHAAMPVKMALRLCPDAILLKGDMEAYSRYSKLVTEVVRAESPLFEKSSIDEFYVDLSGMDRYVGCWQWSRELRQKIMRETGLPISTGLAINKLVSKIGTGEAKPNGEQLVQAGIEKQFIAPLTVSKLPSVGKVTCKKLRFMGIRTIQTLSNIPPRLLLREFGQQGNSLWKKANAIDDAPVVPYTDQKSVSTERTFQLDTIDVRQLKSVLNRMLSKLAFELRQDQRLASIVTIKIRYTDFNTYTKQRKIPYTANDKILIRHVYELFDQLFERRQLIRLIGVRLSGLVRGRPQMELFEETEDERLLKTMDQIRKRFGSKAVMRAVGL
ncbi:MAG: DNA polymerase IV [Saprospiraceae bacterium]|nr:DNA polymerase IV [Saprospiraceae bacterium]